MLESMQSVWHSSLWDFQGNTPIASMKPIAPTEALSQTAIDALYKTIAILNSFFVE